MSKIWMKNLIARFALKVVFPFGSAGFNYGYCEQADIALRRGLALGIETLKCDIHEISGTFSDGTVFNMWNANKYYAWLCRGNVGAIRWHDERPSASTILEFRKAVSKFLSKP